MNKILKFIWFYFKLIQYNLKYIRSNLYYQNYFYGKIVNIEVPFGKESVSFDKNKAKEVTAVFDKA